MKSSSGLRFNCGQIFKNHALPLSRKVRYVIDMCRSDSPRRESNGTAKFLGFSIHYHQRESLLTLLEEIFVDSQYFIRIKKRNPLIFDVGSNIGLATLFFHMIYPESTIYCFEPDDEMFEYLKRNVEGNGLQNVVLTRSGLSRYSGKAQFYVPSWSSGSSSLYREKVEIQSRYARQCLGEEGISLRQKEVDVVKGSDFIIQHDIHHIDLMKIDAEGAEAQIIEDISDVLDRIGFIVLEYHYAKDLVEKNSLVSIISFLEKADFLVSVRPTWFTDQPDVMCTYLVKAVNGRYLNDYAFDSSGTF